MRARSRSRTPSLFLLTSKSPSCSLTSIVCSVVTTVTTWNFLRFSPGCHWPWRNPAGKSKAYPGGECRLSLGGKYTGMRQNCVVDADLQALRNTRRNHARHATAAPGSLFDLESRFTQYTE